jgi:preprotein translocase subunit Sss1
VNERELLAAKVKLAGLMLLGLICAAIYVMAPP